MPLFEYQCQAINCRKIFERLIPKEKEMSVCPICGGKVKKISSKTSKPVIK